MGHVDREVRFILEVTDQGTRDISQVADCVNVSAFPKELVKEVLAEFVGANRYAMLEQFRVSNAQRGCEQGGSAQDATVLSLAVVKDLAGDDLLLDNCGEGGAGENQREVVVSNNHKAFDSVEGEGLESENPVRGRITRVWIAPGPQS